MNNRLLTVILLLCSMGICALFMGCASDGGPKDTTMNYWDKKKGNCDEVLSMPHAYQLSQISYCTKMWETYRYVDNIPIKERSMYAVAFSTVSYNSPDPYDRGVADAALARICIPRHPRDSSGQIREEIPDSLQCDSNVKDINISGQAIASSNPYARIKRSVRIKEVADKDTKAANAAYKRATEQRKKKSLGKAIDLYREALSNDPYHVSAKYDLACALAVSGNDTESLRHLEELYTWDDSEAEQRIVKARTDEDFESIRDNPNFKLITGYVRVALINGASSIGEPTVAEMKKKLESKNIPVAEVGKSHRVELQPQIWYREGFDGYAYKIKEILGKNKMLVQAMKNTDSNNDILIVWGQPEATAIGAGQSKPVVQGTRAKGSDNKLDDLVKEVEGTKNSVDHAQDVGNKLTQIPGT